MQNTETDIDKLANLDSDDNDELVPMDEDDIEDMPDTPAKTEEPPLKPISKSGLTKMLENIKDQKIGFKFGEVYFEIVSVDLNKGTFTSKPANQIINDMPKKSNQRKRLSQKQKKKKRKK